jgi:hypothetical protein
VAGRHAFVLVIAFDPKQKTGREIAGRFAPGLLATSLTWLQADRPNHHGTKVL